MGQLSTPLAEIPALFAEISARRVTRLSHINSEPAKQYFNIATKNSPLPSNSASRVTRLHINKPLDGHHAISFPFLLAKNSNVSTLGPGSKLLIKFPGVRMTTDSYTYTFHFPTPSIERIYYFEILMFRDSIDIYFKSTFSIFLTMPNVPTKIVNVPTDQA